MENINKSTHEPYNTELFAPIIKDVHGDYIAVLSDTSSDRDDEFVGKQAIEGMQLSGYVAGLIDHENKVLNQVCEWVNKRVVEIDGHTALIAEPKFFLSNPNAVIIKGMLDDGAKIGISIGAIVKAYEDTKVGDTMTRTFTDLELLEASFVAIPSNRHGRAMAVAKSFNRDNKKKMSKELNYTQKDIDSAVLESKKGFDTQISDLNKQLESKDTKISELEKSVSDNKELVKVAETKVEVADTKVEELEKSLEDEKKSSLEKQKFADQGGDDENQKMSEEEIDKAYSKGLLPIGRINN